MLTREQKQGHHRVGKHRGCPPSVVETLPGPCILGSSRLWPPHTHCSVCRHSTDWLHEQMRRFTLKLAAAAYDNSYLQAIFGLHLLQLLLPQCFFILLGKCRTFRNTVIVNLKSVFVNHIRLLQTTLSSVYQPLHKTIGGFSPVFSSLLCLLRWAIIWPGSHPSHVSVPEWMWKESTVSPIFTSSPCISAYGSHLVLGCRQQ